jgi:hypothetical protein
MFLVSFKPRCAADAHRARAHCGTLARTARHCVRVLISRAHTHGTANSHTQPHAVRRRGRRCGRGRPRASRGRRLREKGRGELRLGCSARRASLRPRKRTHTHPHKHTHTPLPRTHADAAPLGSVQPLMLGWPAPPMCTRAVRPSDLPAHATPRSHRTTRVCS